MSRRSDEQHVAAIRRCLDELYEACKAAVESGLEVDLYTSIDDEEKVPRLDAAICRRWEA